MKQDKKLLDRAIAKAAYQVAKKDVNSFCIFLFYQQTIPDSLMKLKKHR